MRTRIQVTGLALVSLLFPFTAFGQGVLITDGVQGSLLRLVASEIDVSVRDQVAEVSSVQTFVNDLGSDTVAVYAFPLPEDAAAVRLRYRVNGQWYESQFSPSPQDTVLPGEDTTIVDTDPTHPALQQYLGGSALYFNFDMPLEAGSEAVFDLSYVQLLSYGFNTASFTNPGQYQSLGVESIEEFRFNATVSSQRAIIDANLTGGQSLLAQGVVHSSDSASLVFSADDWPVEEHLTFSYGLDPNSTDIIVFSTYLPDSLSTCDSLGNGFFGMLIEPDGEQPLIVDKDFILIIDRSGSMGVQGMEQAKQAAHHILDNLNPNDRFNIVVFSSSSSSFAWGLQPVNANTLSNGHNYISSLTANGMTNISSSFNMAVPMFSSSDPDAAKVIVFMTDGQANQGISQTPQLVSHVNSLVANAGLSYDFSLFSFGVAGANEQLLNQLANQNNGEAFYINDVNFGVVMADFYNTIQNPVLLNTQIDFDQPSVSSIYPAQLPNLYLGQQLAIFGRYSQPGDLGVTLSGVNVGNAVTHEYAIELTGQEQSDMAFLPKLWAKRYISHLMAQYYNENNLTGPVADSLKALVIRTSMCFGVLSPFTSFQSGEEDNSNVIGIEEREESHGTGPDNRFMSFFPNPFDTEVTFDLTEFNRVEIRVYDLNGRLVWEYDGQGGGMLAWSGTGMDGQQLKAGLYHFHLNGDDRFYWGRMQKL